MLKRDILDRWDIESYIDDEEGTKEERKVLQELLDDSSADTFVLESYFTEYAKAFAEDVGYINGPEVTAWPYNHIDWEEAANELKGDYTPYEINGYTYYGQE